MTRKRKRRNVAGYVWDRRMQEAITANREARETLAAIHDHIRAVCPADVNLLLVSQLLTSALLKVAETRDALIELRAIAEAQKRALAGGDHHLPTGPARSTHGETSPGTSPNDKDEETNK